MEIIVLGEKHDTLYLEVSLGVVCGIVAARLEDGYYDDLEGVDRLELEAHLEARDWQSLIRFLYGRDSDGYEYEDFKVVQVQKEY